eukprot:3825005-Amphidinium_carterae.1
MESDCKIIKIVLRDRMFYQKFVEESESHHESQQKNPIQERHKWPAGSLKPDVEGQSEVSPRQNKGADALKDLLWERSTKVKAERCTRGEEKSDRTVQQSECFSTLYSSHEEIAEVTSSDMTVDRSIVVSPSMQLLEDVSSCDTAPHESSAAKMHCQATLLDSPTMQAQLPYGFRGQNGLAMAANVEEIKKRGWKVWADRKGAKAEGASRGQSPRNSDEHGSERQVEIDLEEDLEQESEAWSGADEAHQWKVSRVKELYTLHQPTKMVNIQQYLTKYRSNLMQLIWAMEANFKYEGHKERSSDPAAKDATDEMSEPETTMLRQRWAILPAAELPLWLPERIRTKLARSEDSTSRPFMCLRCVLGMGQPSKRKSFQTVEDLWAHFYTRHMDGVNVQHLVEKLVSEWANLDTADREAALGWARDAGRSFNYDVREVLGLTGVPGQNGWKARPKLPREWPPPQLAKGKLKGQAAEKQSPVEGKRPYPFGPLALQQRAEKQGREVQQERCEERQPEQRAERRGREVQRERREEQQPEKQRERREERQPEAASKVFKLIPAQEVGREVKGSETGRSGKRRVRSDETESMTMLSLKEKRQRRLQVRKAISSDRSSYSQGDRRKAKAPVRRQGRQSRSQTRTRRGAAPSPSSSLDRLLQDVATSSDDNIERKVMEVKRMNRQQAEAQKRADEDDHHRLGSGSMDAPTLFKRLRKSGMTPLQVGKVAVELQVLALAVESKGESQEMNCFFRFSGSGCTL